MPGVSAGITEMATFNGTLYVGGGFAAVGTNSGGGVPVDLSSGRLTGPYAKVAGTVYACVPDGRGGWFIGGEFGGVGGQRRSNLAHITAAGAVSSWTVETDGRVNALALGGNVLYVGGRFEHVGGTERGFLAAVRASNGEVLAWDPNVGGVGKDFTTVLALALRDGVLYVGGDFAQVGGVERANLAAVDVQTAITTGFVSDADDKVYALALSDSVLYVGGAFRAIGGIPRLRLAALRMGSGTVTDFDPHVDAAYYSFDVAPFVAAIALDDTLAYIAGHFTRVGGEVRGGLAAIGIASGRTTAWNPNSIDESRLMSAPLINAIQVRDGIAFVGGFLDTLGGQRRYSAAAVSVESGLATDWFPRMLSTVFALALGDGVVYLGGGFTVAEDWEDRSYLAAFDLATSTLLPWRPTCDGVIGAIVVDSAAVYIGGSFAYVNGEFRPGLAALDRATGELLPWNPGVNAFVTSLALVGGRLLVGGDFTRLGGAPRQFLGSVDARTGILDDWAPSPSSLVISMAVEGTLAYITGLFTSVASQPRQFCAAVDIESGTATPWDPSPDVFVESIAVGPGAVYLGGPFRSVGGASRESIAAVDKITGTATDWNPDAQMWHPYGGARVNSILVLDSAVYVGGNFASIGGAQRNLVAALSPTTGLARGWDLEMVGDAVTSLATWDERLYVGGVFSRMGVHPTSGIGSCSLARPPLTPPSILTLGPSFPNPASSSAGVAFALPASTKVSLDVFDILGRRVAAVLSGEQRPAGWNEVSFDVHDWQPGCYLYRLQAGSQAAAGKLLVVR